MDSGTRRDTPSTGIAGDQDGQLGVEATGAVEQDLQSLDSAEKPDPGGHTEQSGSSTPEACEDEGPDTFITLTLPNGRIIKLIHIA